MSETSRRLSYRKRKKLGLTFSEAFMEEAGPHKARSVDRGYASVMSPASVEQGDEQSEWDERQARVDQSDGLSRMMTDLTSSKAGDEATEEIFVGEGNMKEAMLAAFTDELSKLASASEEGTLGDVLIDSFLDELEKEAGPMDILRRRTALAKGAKPTRASRAYGRGRLKGKVKTTRAAEARAARTGSGEDLLRAQQASADAERRVSAGSKLNPLNWVRNRRSAARATRGGALEGRAKTVKDVNKGSDIQRTKNVRDRGQAAPADALPQPAAPGAADAAAADQAAAAQQAAAADQAAAAAAAPAAPPAEPGWLGQQWAGLTDPIRAGYAGGGLWGGIKGIGSGINAAPALGLPLAGLAGAALLPPALRAAGLGRRESPGAVPGYVNLPG